MTPHSTRPTTRSSPRSMLVAARWNWKVSEFVQKQIEAAMAMQGHRFTPAAAQVLQGTFTVMT